MEELELIVGARVYCRNGKYGRLAKIVVDPRRWCVTHIIVEEGFLKKRFRVLPISLVEQATTGDVYLAVCDDDMATFPEFNPDAHAQGALAQSSLAQSGATRSNGAASTSDHGIAPNLIVVERGTPIENGHGDVGRLDYVLVDAGDGEITGFVLQQRVIPNAMVQHIDRERISVVAIPANQDGLHS